VEGLLGSGMLRGRLLPRRRIAIVQVHVEPGHAAVKKKEINE
jgi:hypothetical protein